MQKNISVICRLLSYYIRKTCAPNVGHLIIVTINETRIDYEEYKLFNYFIRIIFFLFCNRKVCRPKRMNTLQSVQGLQLPQII